MLGREGRGEWEYGREVRSSAAVRGVEADLEEGGGKTVVGQDGAAAGGSTRSETMFCIEREREEEGEGDGVARGGMGIGAWLGGAEEVVLVVASGGGGGRPGSWWVKVLVAGVKWMGIFCGGGGG